VLSSYEIIRFIIEILPDQWPYLTGQSRSAINLYSHTVRSDLTMELSLLLFYWRNIEGAFSHHRLCLIWHRTLDPRPLFTANRSVGRAIPDYFSANQWSRTCVSENGNHFLLIESQPATQLVHYRLPLFPVQLCAVNRVNFVVKSTKFLFPTILVWDWKRVNVAR